MSSKPSYLDFNTASYPWKPDIDYRVHPDLYRVGKGEQGVLICEPYKNEIGRYRRFKDQEIAKESSEKIYGLFADYLNAGDFVGADMARNICKWVIPGHAVMPIIKAGKNMTKIRATNC